MPSDATVILVGHIGEPKFQQVGEHLVCRFGLATSRKRKDSEVTTWWNCTVWRKDAEFLQKYAKKGNLLSVHGDAYEDEYEGKKSMKVEARKVMILTAKGDNQESSPAIAHHAAKPYDSQQNRSEPRKPTGGGSIPDDEPPFARPLIAEVWG